jgi:hypothetical protein
MSSVVSHGVVNPGCVLSVQWQDKQANPHVPSSGTDVTCHCLSGGVLYVARGQVQSAGDGPQPRLRIQLDPVCLAMHLRKFERYEAWAKLALIDEDQTVILEFRSPQLINLSQGGFGLSTRQLGLKPGKVLGFNLEVSCQAAPPDGSEEPFRISGAAIVRMSADDKDKGTCYLGLQFDSLPEATVQDLEMWQAQHHASLRVC